MITNERQYRITKAQLKRFDDDLAAHDARKPAAGVDPRLHQAMRDALASEADELRTQIASASPSSKFNGGRPPPMRVSVSTASRTSPTPSAATSARTSPTAAPPD